MFSSLLGKLNPYKYIAILAIVTAVGGYIYALKSTVNNTEEKLNSAVATNVTKDETIKNLNSNITVLETKLSIEKENYLISQAGVKELKDQLAIKPIEKIKYVKEYIENTSISKCTMSSEWLSAYEKTRYNPYLVLPERKD